MFVHIFRINKDIHKNVCILVKYTIKQFMSEMVHYGDCLLKVCLGGACLTQFSSFY